MRSDSVADDLVGIAGADDHRSGVVVEDPCLRGDLPLSDDHAQGLTFGQRAVGQPRRQRGIVGEDRAGTDHDRVGGRAEAVHVGARGLAGDPLAGAVRRRRCVRRCSPRTSR